MRIHHSRPASAYTVIPNAALQDERLSYAARGMLAYLLSLPDGWNTNADELARRAGLARPDKARGEGRRAMRAVFGELKDRGYMRNRPVPKPGGRWGTEVDVSDVPLTDVPVSGTSEPPAETWPEGPADDTSPVDNWPGGGAESAGVQILHPGSAGTSRDRPAGAPGHDVSHGVTPGPEGAAFPQLAPTYRSPGAGKRYPGDSPSVDNSLHNVPPARTDVPLTDVPLTERRPAGMPVSGTSLQKTDHRGNDDKSRVGDGVGDWGARGNHPREDQGRSVANSQDRRVHDGPEDVADDAHLRGDNHSERPATDRNARASEPIGLANGDEDSDHAELPESKAGGAGAPLSEPAEPAASDVTSDPGAEEHKRRELARLEEAMRQHPEWVT